MGFTTGFLGGVTLTYSVLYLSLYIHRANRNAQRTLLSQQSTLLNSVVEPLPPIPDPPAYEVRRAGLAEELKDKWNREVEKVVRNAQETDWTRVRESAEEKLSNVWSKIRQSQTGQDIEGKVKDTIAEGKDMLKETVDSGKEKVKEESTTKTQPKRLLEVA